MEMKISFLWEGALTLSVQPFETFQFIISHFKPMAAANELEKLQGDFVGWKRERKKEKKGKVHLVNWEEASENTKGDWGQEELRGGTVPY